MLVRNNFCDFDSAKSDSFFEICMKILFWSIGISFFEDYRIRSIFSKLHLKPFGYIRLHFPLVANNIRKDHKAFTISVYKIDRI